MYVDCMFNLITQDDLRKINKIRNMFVYHWKRCYNWIKIGNKLSYLKRFWGFYTLSVCSSILETKTSVYMAKLIYFFQYSIDYKRSIQCNKQNYVRTSI